MWHSAPSFFLAPFFSFLHSSIFLSVLAVRASYSCQLYTKPRLECQPLVCVTLLYYTPKPSKYASMRKYLKRRSQSGHSGTGNDVSMLSLFLFCFLYSYQLPANCCMLHAGCRLICLACGSDTANRRAYATCTIFYDIRLKSATNGPMQKFFLWKFL